MLSFFSFFTEFGQLFWENDWLQRALLASLLVGISAPFIGIHLVVRRLSMLAEALSHLALTGIAMGLIAEKNSGRSFIAPFAWGFFSSVIGSFLVEKLRNQRYRYYPELTVPILLAAGLGLGLILLSDTGGISGHAASYLVGSLVTVSMGKLWLIFISTILTIIFCCFFGKELFALSFDEENAVITGVPKGLVHGLMLIITSLVVCSISTVAGILLAPALMVIPVATSLALGGSFRHVLIRSLIISELAVFLGFFAALIWDWPFSGSIAVIAVILFIMVRFFYAIKNDFKLFFCKS